MKGLVAPLNLVVEPNHQNPPKKQKTEQTRSSSPPTSTLTFSSGCGDPWSLSMDDLDLILQPGLVDSFLAFDPIPHSAPLFPLSSPPSLLLDDTNPCFPFTDPAVGLLDQICKAAEFVEVGNYVAARAILARLNLGLSDSGKPLFRSAFHFVEALRVAADGDPNDWNAGAAVTKLDVLLKLSAYKDFAEISPVLQFANFTSVQVIFEEVGGCDRIHIVDFEFGVGGHWSALMQELSLRCGSRPVPALRITAFVSGSSHHPFELNLAQENLSHFAANLNISFELNILSIDSFDPVLIRSMSHGGQEAIVVNIPVRLSYISAPAVLRLVKQLSPKIVVSVDNCCDRSDLSFSQHFLQAIHSSAILLESIDSSGVDVEVVNKIEQFLVKPRISSMVLGRLCGGGKLVPWRTLFALAGFVSVPFSNFTEIQADCLLKKMQTRGYRVEKRQSSLSLFWQNGELASVSAWRC